MVGYEVVLDERVPSDDSGNRVARVTRMEGAPARVDDAVTYTREKVLPLARELEGNRGILSLVDRATGKGMTFTFWASDEAMRASEEAANQVRGDSSTALEMEVVGVGRYEVVIDERF